MAAEKRRCKWRGKRIAWCRKLKKFCDAPREYYTCSSYEPTQSDVLGKVQHNVDALRRRVFRVETKGSYADVSDEMKEAARRFLVPFIRARGYLPQNLSTSRDEIRTALQEWESSKEYMSRETYEYIRTMLVDIDNLLEKQQVAAAITKMETIWAFMMTRAFGPPAKLPYIASPFPEGFPSENEGWVVPKEWLDESLHKKSTLSELETLRVKHFGSELRNMILEGEREGREIGAMICQSPTGELHLSRVCWGMKGKVHVTDCHDHLKPYGSYHVHLHGSGVFSPQDLEQAIDREQISCIGYMKAGVPMLKCITPHKYYEYPQETKTKIRTELKETTKEVALLSHSDTNSPEARKLSGEIQKKLHGLEQLLDVDEVQL